MGLKAFALKTRGHGTAGCGGRHRNGPTGGAANGTPLNTLTSESVVP